MSTVAEQEPSVQTITAPSTTTPAVPVSVEPFLVVTPKAASEVLRIIEDNRASGVSDKFYLRVRVVGGGCSGFQNKLDLEANVNPKTDETFDVHGITVVVDKRSKLYLSGATVDFHDDLNRRGFSITNPQAKSTCGCGSSFSM